jgi:hypothetical protein
MRKLGAGLAAIGLVVAVLGSSPAGAASGGTDRPLKSTGNGTIVINPNNGTFTLESVIHSAHMGSSTKAGSGTLLSATTTAFQFTDVAANGDTLVGTSTGTIVPTANGFTYTNVDTYTGGTGRFAGASGTSTTTGIGVRDPNNPLLNAITISLVGTISY